MPKRAEARGSAAALFPTATSAVAEQLMGGPARTCGAELPTRGADGPRPLLGLHCGAAITTRFERHWLSEERSSCVVQGRGKACPEGDDRRGKFC